MTSDSHREVKDEMIERKKEETTRSLDNDLQTVNVITRIINYSTNQLKDSPSLRLMVSGVIKED